MSNAQALRSMPSAYLTAELSAQLRALFDLAFAGDEHGGFDDDDWQHALGGTHFIVTEGDRVLAHASVVERELHIGGLPIRTGYVEAVATLPARQREGHGSRVMSAVNAHIRAGYELGGLGTGSQGFYERLGWKVWPGPSYVRTENGLVRSADEDGYIMILETPASPRLDQSLPISCDWRPGDSW